MDTKGKLIALYSDAAGSGKSEVAKTLIAAGYQTVKFAGPLKDMVRGLLRSMGIDDVTVERMIEGDLKETVIPGFKTVTPRHIMQTLGTDWGREAIDQDLWTKVAGAKIEQLRGQGVDVVVDDLRFPNEYDLIVQLDGFTAKVDRPNPTGEVGGSYEGKLSDWRFDATVRNDDSLQKLHDAALVLDAFA